MGDKSLAGNCVERMLRTAGVAVLREEVWLPAPSSARVIVKPSKNTIEKIVVFIRIRCFLTVECSSPSARVIRMCAVRDLLRPINVQREKKLSFRGYFWAKFMVFGEGGGAIFGPFLLILGPCFILLRVCPCPSNKCRDVVQRME